MKFIIFNFPQNWTVYVPAGGRTDRLQYSLSCHRELWPLTIICEYDRKGVTMNHYAKYLVTRLSRSKVIVRRPIHAYTKARPIALPAPLKWLLMMIMAILTYVIIRLLTVRIVQCSSNLTHFVRCAVIPFSDITFAIRQSFALSF